MAGIWADKNDIHIYVGDTEASLSSQPFYDVEEYLKDRGFNLWQADASIGTGGERTYEHPDSRRMITLRLKVGDLGIMSITDATASQGTNPASMETMSDLINFVELGRDSEAPKNSDISDDARSNIIDSATVILRALRKHDRPYPGGEVSQNPDAGGEVRMQEENMGPGGTCLHEDVHPGLSHSQFMFGRQEVTPSYTGAPAAPLAQGRAEAVVTAPMQKGMEVAIDGVTASGPAIFCDWCHTATGFNNSMPYKGLRVCRKCWAQKGPIARIVK